MLDMGPMLEKFKVMLASEEEYTIKMQLNNFMYDALQLNLEDENDIYEEFNIFLNLLKNEESDLNKYTAIMNSPFIHYIISFKPNAREKELRRLTYHLSDFIEKIGHHGGQRNYQTLATTIREVTKNIEPRKNKGTKESMNEAWRRNLQDGVVKRFK